MVIEIYFLGGVIFAKSWYMAVAPLLPPATTTITIDTFTNYTLVHSTLAVRSSGNTYKREKRNIKAAVRVV